MSEEELATEGGFIVSYRRVTDGDVCDNAMTFALWQYLLHKAEWRPVKRRVAGRAETIGRGSLFFVAADLAARWKIHRGVLDRALAYLEETGRIASEKRHRGCVVSIVKYDGYQPRQQVDQSDDASETEAKREAGESEAKSNQNRTASESPNSPSETGGCDPLTSEQANKGIREQGNKGSTPSGKRSARAPKDGEPTEFQKLCRATWEAYSAAFFSRYGTEPVRDAQVNRAVVNFCKRLGQESPEVIRFFVAHAKASYVQNCHPLPWAVTDAQALRTQWATGRKISSGEAAAAERLQANQDAIRRAMERAPLEGGEA